MNISLRPLRKPYYRLASQAPTNKRPSTKKAAAAALLPKYLPLAL